MSTPRRIMRWEKVKGPRPVLAVVIGTALGAGFFPMAPGTMGTLVAIPLAYASWDWPVLARVSLWTGLAAIGTWSAKVFDETMGSKDNQNIVIDEVVGLGITAWTVGPSAVGLAAAFVLFRFFDVLKPPPVRQIDAWSKSRAGDPRWGAWFGGFGVMADDIAAGFQGLLVVLILQHFGLLPRA